MNEKPTNTRYRMLFVICIFFAITYLDRATMSVAAPVMAKDFGLDKFELGLIFSAFGWSYALCQLPTGMLGDRFGPRKVMSLLVIWWSLFTAATGAVFGFTSLLIVRLLFGIGEAGAMPNANRSFSCWMPATERGFANGITHSCARVAAAAAPPVVVAIMVLWGWRSVFYIFGFAGIAWGIFWYVWYRDTPEEFNQRWGSVMNQAERDLIEGGQKQRRAVKVLPVSQLLRSRNLWFLGMSDFMYNFIYTIYLTWLPTYLVDARGFTLVKMGIYASLPLLAGAIGDLAGGWISDVILRRTGNAKLARRSVPMFGLILAAVLTPLGGIVDSPYLAVWLFSAGLLCLELPIANYYTVPLDVAPESAGSAVGMVSSIGSLAGGLSPAIFGAIVQLSDSWALPFILSSGILLVGAALWMFVDPGLSLEDELAALDKRRTAAAHA